MSPRLGKDPASPPMALGSHFPATVHFCISLQPTPSTRLLEAAESTSALQGRGLLPQDGGTGRCHVLIALPCVWDKDVVSGAGVLLDAGHRKLLEQEGNSAFLFFKSSPEICFTDLERGEGRQREGERHGLVVSHMHPLWGLNLQPRHVL